MKTLRSDSQHPWHRFPGRSFILALLILASGCTTTIPRTDLPLITNESCGDQVKVVTVPLPVIASSPNEGITAGALSAFLIHDTRDEIYSLLAPQLNYNQNFGFTGTLYGSVNPSPEQNIEFNLSQSQKKNFDYEARIRDISLMNGNLELKGFLGWFADGSSRFFGFHARTPGEQETNYTNREITYNLSAPGSGTALLSGAGHRFRSVSIGQVAITSYPLLQRSCQAGRPGVEGFTTHAPRISLIYSTYDSKTLPTYGG